jgi:hypothetical protein
MAKGSGSIKGITVAIGADTSSFIKGLKSIDREINQTQKTANELQKGLKLEYNEKNFVQAQKQIQKALETTENKAESIRKEMQKLEQSGNVDTDGYRKLETELAKTENTATKLKQQLEEVDKIKLENAYKGVNNLSKGLESAAKKTALLSGAAVGAIAGITKLAKDAVASGDDIQTLADKYNLSAEAIQRWNYVALQSDVPAEQLYKSMTKARDAIGTALVGGTSTAKTALESLIGDLSKVPTDTEGAFNTVIMALANVKDSTLQAYYANEIFGERVATDLIPLLNQGADGLAKLGREFESVGYLSNEQVRALADYDNELNNFNTRITNAKTELGLALLPILDRFVTLLEDNVIPAIKSLTEWFDGLSPSMQDIITGGLLLFAALSPVLLIISKLIGAISNLAKAFQFLKKHVTATQLGFAALAGAIGLTFDLIGNWKQMSTIEKILKSLAVAALVAAAAVTVFHASWSLGIAVGVIAASVVAGIAAIKAAGEEIGVETSEIDSTSGNYNTGNYNTGDYTLPSSQGNYGNYTDQTSNYNDYSNVVINIEKNEYMTEDDIIRAVNKGLKQAKQSRT